MSSEKVSSGGSPQENTPATTSSSPSNRRHSIQLQVTLVISFLIGLSFILSLYFPWTHYPTFSTSSHDKIPSQALPRILPRVPRQLRFGSFNIRYDGTGGRDTLSTPPPATLNFLTQRIKRSNSPSPHLTAYGERPWRERKTKVADSVIWSELDVVGFQEVLVNQLRDLEGLLGGYEGVGVGRDDGMEKGEAVPIFWKR